MASPPSSQPAVWSMKFTPASMADALTKGTVALDSFATLTQNLNGVVADFAAQDIHAALMKKGHAVIQLPLESFRNTETTRIVLADRDDDSENSHNTSDYNKHEVAAPIHSFTTNT